MGIFSSIASAIFGSKAAAETTAAAAPSAAPATYSMASETSTPAAAPASAAASAPTASSAPQPVTRAQVEAIIAKIEADRGVKYNWRQSIVDLMKLLDLDSSLGARKELAQELGYKGALDGSAEMNVWLHKQVMEKLAEGGGKVPASLKG
jgi:3-oxoacyl-ACP reductase-like protein